MKVIPEEKPMTGREVRFATWAFVVILLIALAMIVFAPGCTRNPFSTSTGRLEVSWIAYNSTLDAIQILIDAGEISKADAVIVAVFIKDAKRRLDVWHAKNLAGVDASDAERAAKTALATLKEKVR